MCTSVTMKASLYSSQCYILCAAVSPNKCRAATQSSYSIQKMMSNNTCNTQ